MEKITERVWLLEQATKKQTEADIEGQHRAAYARLMAALRDALPGDPVRFETGPDGWGRRWLIDQDHRSHEDMMLELNHRILSGSMTNADRDLLASLSADDLATTGQTAKELIGTACAILSAY